MNSTSFLPLLAELLIKSAPILLAAALVDRAWRRASAAQRHAIWLAAFVALLLLPATRFIAPRWNLAPARPAEARVLVVAEPAPVGASINVVAPAPVTINSAPSPSYRFDWSVLAINLWWVGGLAMLGWRAAGSLRLRWILRTSIVGDASLCDQLHRVAEEFGVARLVALRVSPACRVPLTWGTLRPVLVLPEDCAAWPGDRLLAVFRHEMAHIRRGDHAVRLLADLARVLYWPNPLVWLASRALHRTQEQSCDDLVLNAGTCPTDYATLLCETASRFSAPQGAMAMAQPSTLKSRVVAIVDAKRDRRPLTLRAAIFGATFATLALAASTAAQLRAMEQAPISPGGAAAYETGIQAPTPADATARDDAPQIKIEARFVEVAPDADVDQNFLLQALPREGAARSSILGVLTDPTLKQGVRTLNTTKGVNILSSPSVITRSQQNATLDIGQELSYATAWEKGTKQGTWKPTAFDTKRCGPRLEIKAAIAPDKTTLDLTVRSEVVELLGYKDPETGEPLQAGNDDPKAEGPRREAVFSTRAGDAVVSIFNGNTVVMELAQAGDVKPFVKKAPKGRLLVLLTASIVLPNGEKAPPPAPKENRPQIMIDAKFIEITPGQGSVEALFSSLGLDAKAEAKKSIHRVPEKGVPQLVKKALKERKGVNLLNAPRVTTKSGQRAVIEIIREKRYATEWVKGTKRGTWKPTAFETRNTGVTLEAQPVIQADGTINLDLIPQVVDFLGFLNLETGKPMPLETDDSAPEGPRLKAIFSAFKLDAKLGIKPGETVMLWPLKQTDDVKPMADRVRKGTVAVFVTTRLVTPDGEVYPNPFPPTEVVTDVDRARFGK